MPSYTLVKCTSRWCYNFHELQQLSIFIEAGICLPNQTVFHIWTYMKLHTSAGKMSLPLEEPHVWFAIHEIELLIPYTINYINFLNKEITINGKAACLSGDLLFSSFFCPMLHSCSCLFLRRTIKSSHNISKTKLLKKRSKKFSSFPLSLP